MGRARAAVLAAGLAAGLGVAWAQQPAGDAPRRVPATPQEAAERVREVTRGMASWYGDRFHGRRTASGERYDMNGFTAAHPTLPFGTVVEVRSLVNGKSVQVRINDRGPFGGKRVIDVSAAAAQALGLKARGTKRVEFWPVDSGEPGLRLPGPSGDASEGDGGAGPR